MAEEKSCSFCLKNAAKYTCPRCNMLYCSANCYKSEAHSECSESFYKDCFMEGLKNMDNSKDVDKSKVMEMLQRVYSESQDDDEVDHGEDLAERLQSLDLDTDTDKIWEVLTPDERKQFNDMLKDGRLGSLLKVWKPWWCEEVNKVQEIESDTSNDKIKVGESQPLISAKRPMIKCDVVAMKDLLKSKEPSSQVINNVVNVLYAYVYLCRLYNGCYHDVPIQFSTDVQSLCGTFHKEVYESVLQAIVSCHSRLQTSVDCKPLIVSHDFSVAAINDVVTIITGGQTTSTTQQLSLLYVMAALSELHSIFNKSRKQIAKDLKKKYPQGPPESVTNLKQLLFNCEKKAEFLLSYVKSYGAMLTTCIPELELLFCRLNSELTEHNAVKEKVEETKGKGSLQSTNKKVKLIEEL